MVRDKLSFYILLLIIPLYFLQGWLFDHGSIVSQGLVLIWLIIDIIYFIKYVYFKLWEPIGRVFLIFWLLHTITWFLTPLLSTGLNRVSIGWLSTYSMYKNIAIVFLTYFPFYCFTYKGVIDKKQIKLFSLISLLCLVAAFFISYRESSFNLGRDEITNNGAYYLVVIVPLLGLFFDDFIEFFFYGGILLLALVGAKRGAIICAVVEVFLFFYFYFKKSNASKAPLKFILLIIAATIIVKIGINLFEENDYLQMRFDQTVSGDSSLRDEIYLSALSEYQEQDYFKQFFGNGMSSTLSIIGGYAHQDWLELLINNGLVGVFLYLVLFVVLFLYYFKNINRLSIKERFIFLSALLGWLFRSMYSMGYMSIESCYYSMAFAYVCGIQRKLIHNKNI